MVARGLVQNGVVVLQDGVSLPEGQEVTGLAEPQPASQGHSIMDVPTFSVGKILKPFSPDDDLLGEMLEGRS